MYHVSAQGVDERMINVHYYYYISQSPCLVNNRPNTGNLYFSLCYFIAYYCILVM